MMSPALFPVSRIRLRVSVIAELIAMLSLVVVMSAAVAIPALDVIETLPSAMMSADAATVVVPA